MGEKIQRQSLPELLRFIASIMIAWYHFEILFFGGPNYLCHFYIWVEFFFVMSGYYLAHNVRLKNQNSFSYVKRQLTKLFPLYAAAFFVCCFSQFLANNTSVTMRDFFQTVWNTKSELFLVQIWGGVNPELKINLGGASAYVSTLLIGTLILHCFLQTCIEKSWTKVFLLLFSIMGYMHIIYVYGNLSQWFSYDVIAPVGVLRALCGMSVGVVLHETDLYLQNKKLVKILTLCFCILCCFVLAVGRYYIGYADLVIYPYIFGILLKILDNAALTPPQKIQQYFLLGGKMSMVIFFFHYAAINFMIYLFHKFGISAGEVGYCGSFAIFTLFIIILGAAVRTLEDTIHIVRKRGI